MQVTLSPDEAAQRHPETGEEVKPGSTVEVSDDIGKSLLDQTDKWLRPKKTTAKKGAD